MEAFQFVDNEDGILFLGEGNFSFSSSLIHNMSQSADCLSNIWSSCYESDDSKNEINQSNSQACTLKQQNMNYLKSRGCHVLEGVDAENLESEQRISGLKFSKIIFMFPHVGGKMKINRNRKLLLNVIRSSRKMITVDGDIVVTLARGQGGTPVDSCQRSASDTWKLVDMCHEADCVLTHVDVFPLEKFPLYQQVGYRGLYKGFNAEGGMVHTIKKMESRNFKCISKLDDNFILSLDSVDFFKQPSLYPPVHIHHLSFWLPGSTSHCLDERLIEDVIEQTEAKDVVTRMKTVELYKDVQKGVTSQTLELEFCDTHYPLGHTRALHLLIDIIGKSLENTCSVKLR